MIFLLEQQDSTYPFVHDNNNAAEQLFSCRQPRKQLGKYSPELEAYCIPSLAPYFFRPCSGVHLHKIQSRSFLSQIS